ARSRASPCARMPKKRGLARALRMPTMLRRIIAAAIHRIASPTIGALAAVGVLGVFGSSSLPVSGASNSAGPLVCPPGSRLPPAPPVVQAEGAGDGAAAPPPARPAGPTAPAPRQRARQAVQRRRGLGHRSLASHHLPDGAERVELGPEPDPRSLPDPALPP